MKTKLDLTELNLFRWEKSFSTHRHLFNQALPKSAQVRVISANTKDQFVFD